MWWAKRRRCCAALPLHLAAWLAHPAFAFAHLTFAVRTCIGLHSCTARSCPAWSFVLASAAAPSHGASEGCLHLLLGGWGRTAGPETSSLPMSSSRTHRLHALRLLQVHGHVRQLAEASPMRSGRARRSQPCVAAAAATATRCRRTAQNPSPNYTRALAASPLCAQKVVEGIKLVEGCEAVMYQASAVWTGQLEHTSLCWPLGNCVCLPRR